MTCALQVYSDFLNEDGEISAMIDWKNLFFQGNLDIVHLSYPRIQAALFWFSLSLGWTINFPGISSESKIQYSIHV